jgi:hypothetical protein
MLTGASRLSAHPKLTMLVLKGRGYLRMAIPRTRTATTNARHAQGGVYRARLVWVRRNEMSTRRVRLFDLLSSSSTNKSEGSPGDGPELRGKHPRPRRARDRRAAEGN